MSDALWLYGQGKAHGDRWADRVEPRRGGDPGDARDCDSIIEELRKRGLEVVDD